MVGYCWADKPGHQQRATGQQQRETLPVHPARQRICHPRELRVEWPQLPVIDKHEAGGCQTRNGMQWFKEDNIASDAR